MPSKFGSSHIPCYLCHLHLALLLCALVCPCVGAHAHEYNVCIPVCCCWSLSLVTGADVVALTQCARSSLGVCAAGSGYIAGLVVWKVSHTQQCCVVCYIYVETLDCLRVTYS